MTVMKLHKRISLATALIGVFVIGSYENNQTTPAQEHVEQPVIAEAVVESNKPETRQQETQATILLDDKHLPEEMYEYNRIEEAIFTSKEEAYDLAPLSPFKDDADMEFFKKYEYLTKNEIEILYRQIDMDLLNEEFGILLNNYRIEQGVGELNYNPDFLAGSTYIVKEMADTGYFASEGQYPHTRPAPNLGQSTNTVFEGIQYEQWSGENLTNEYSRNNPYRLLSEKYLAEKFFDGWYHSEGHRLNMINEHHTGFVFTIYPVMNGNTMRGVKKEDGRYYDITPATEINGFGIIGITTFTR